MGGVIGEQGRSLTKNIIFKAAEDENYGTKKRA
jgi:hypothetical protein